MTQEEKAKAYDEALERARKLYESYNRLVLSTDEIERIFPELAESEDERIREEMIRYFTEMKKGGSAALPYDDCIAYLKKQKEQKSADEAEKFFDSVESYNQGFVAGQKKMKEDTEKGFGISEHSLDYLAGRYAGYAAAKQEWSEEDENGMFSDIIMAIRAYYKCEREDLVDYVKSLRPSWKPSEEQMEAMKNIAYGMYQNGDGPILRELYEQLEKLM